MQMSRILMTIASLTAFVTLVGTGSMTAHAADSILTGQAAYGDYTKDAPGVWRRFTPGDMPKAYATQSARNVSTLIPRPEGALPKVPPGFSVSVFASGFKQPRVLKAAPNGDIFLAETGGGTIRVLRTTGGTTSVATFADGLDRPFGIAFYPPGPNPRYVYVGLTKAIIRYPYRVGDLKASGPAETVVPNIPEGGHFTRDVLFTQDGKNMFVAIGSGSNIQDKGPDNELFRANILEFNPDGTGRRIYAAGLRNPVSIAFDPRTGQLWACVNERDLMGDDLPPDYVTHVQQGANYGWPYYYIGGNPDARPQGTPPVRADQVTIPDVLIQPHSAPLGVAFYNAKQFPAEYQGDIFVTLHGSWNRQNRTGYKIVRVKMKDGKATGAYEDFLTGFVTDDGKVWGRPVSIMVAPDGSLLMSEDGNGTIWRIAYTR